MKLTRLMALILLTSLGTALFALSHAHSKAHKAVAAASRELVQNNDTGLILAGTVVPMITTPIIRQDFHLAVPLDSWVERGEVIGTAESPTAPWEMDSAWQEVGEAISVERRAEDRVRQVEEELGRMQAQAGNMDGQEVRAESAKLDAERELERRDTFFRFGLTSSVDFDTAVMARDSAEAAVESMRSNLAAAAIDTDEREAEAQEAKAELREATTSRSAAEVAFERVRGGSHDELIVSPADGIIVASGLPEGTSFGIASDPRQLRAYAMVRAADLMAVRVGQESLIALDARPAVTFHAQVSAISETPVDSPEGAFYQVTFVVDNPGGTWLSGAAMHARMVRSDR
jgi:hypothetical protein